MIESELCTFIKSLGGNSTAYNEINWNLIGVQKLSFSVICSCFQIIFPQGIFPVVFFFLSNCKRINTNFLSVISLLRSLHKEKEVRMYVLKLLLTIFSPFYSTTFNLWQSQFFLEIWNFPPKTVCIQFMQI